MMNNRHNIFLDAGGIILDEESHERVRAEVISEVLSHLLPSYTIENYWSCVEEAVTRYVPRVYDYVIFSALESRERFALVKEQYLSLWEERRPQLVLTSGLEPVLDHLSKKYNIGILGQYGVELTQVLEDHNLLKYFTYSETQEKFKITKPDPRYFEMVLQRAGAMASHSIMVGDRIDKDVIPAKQIGMKTIRVRIGIHKNQRPRTPDEFPDIEIDTLPDIVRHTG